MRLPPRDRERSGRSPLSLGSQGRAKNTVSQWGPDRHSHLGIGSCVLGGLLPPPQHLVGGLVVQHGCELPPAPLQTVSSSPYLGGGRGAASLCLLNVLHRDIHPLLGQRWATTIALLLEYLEGEAQELGACTPLCLSGQLCPVGTRVP